MSAVTITDVISPELSFREHLTLTTILDLRANQLRERIAFWRGTDAQGATFSHNVAFDEEQLREVEALKQKLALAATPYLSFNVSIASEEKGA